MILVDTALEERHNQKRPIRVAMIGAGFMGKGIALQICKYVKGMELVAIANRNVVEAEKAYLEAGVSNFKSVRTSSELQNCLKNSVPVVTEDAQLICQSDEAIEAIIEVTGAVAYAAPLIREAIKNKKHIISMNAEMDATIGPLLKVFADQEGVIYTASDGDQPGVIMNLFRFVKGIGVKPVLCGNIKGLHDPYRNPTTQESFAKKWGQKPTMVTSFADGSKISFEQAIVANGTGMLVAKRGMHGPTVATGTSIMEVADQFNTEELLKGPGIVDYVVGAYPAPGVFVLGTIEDSRQRHYLNLYKLGEGPLYCFYRPYHLCHFEVPYSVARAVLLGDATLAPIGKPLVDVIATAKIDLKSGQVLDGIGGYMSYGLCENSTVANQEKLLPLGLAEGCLVKRDIQKDQVLTYDDIQLPENRELDRLREQQNNYFR